MSEHRVESRVLLAGFEAARLRCAQADPGTDEAFHAIFEALAWIGSIRDRLVADSLEQPPIVDGLYYMRNVVLHQGADVLDWLLIFNPGAYGSTTFGGTGFGGGIGEWRSWRWPAPGKFPEPRSAAGVSEYHELLAGESVEETLEVTEAALRDVWGLSGDSVDRTAG